MVNRDRHEVSLRLFYFDDRSLHIQNIFKARFFDGVFWKPNYIFSNMSACEADYNPNFWCMIEKDLGGRIPTIVKNVLAKSGYENRICLENIAVTDIDDIEAHARGHLQEKLKRWLKNEDDYTQISPNDFSFLPGHRKILSLISGKLTAAKGEPLENHRHCSSRGDDQGMPTKSIPITEETELVANLCQIIQNWMIRKKFHESVSKYKAPSCCFCYN